MGLNGGAADSASAAGKPSLGARMKTRRSDFSLERKAAATSNVWPAQPLDTAIDVQVDMANALVVGESVRNSPNFFGLDDPE